MRRAGDRVRIVATLVDGESGRQGWSETYDHVLDDIFEVLSTAGDNFLGGDDFDEKIVFEMLTQFKKQHGFAIENNPVATES